MRRVAVALSVGLALLVVAILAILTRSPLTVIGTNSVPAAVTNELQNGNLSRCQSVGTFPKGTSAIRIAIEPTSAGPTVTAKVLSGTRVLTEGQLVSGWGAASSATVPVKPLAQTLEDAVICTAIGPAVLPFRIRGTPARRSAAGANKLQDMFLSMEYMRPGPQSWWSLAPSIAYHMGLGRAASGAWIVYFTIALMLAVVILSARLTLKELS
ncbi:MAG TPA: hypothetical protein VGP18_00685 [Solirubrobacteraceae bacterium]|jgi:hypothetical protein|nr:hypothetical protein [Solirubrobacteraceae bacterium]